ncbi:MAG: hypothetical protein M1838_001605 [Thelocarpon superellum]|nr:MAG: hypothetical protein M1838_001605 [Thelocarpon superellum]
MAASLLMGILFAIIHHLYYSYWDSREVASDNQQKWVIRGGTVFAFCFKTALAMGAAVAYTQYLWLSLRAKSHNADRINTMFTVLTNALHFRHLATWTEVPVLAGMAIITWMLPLAAIIAPGTMIVNTVLLDNMQHILVPQFNFDNWQAFGTAAVPFGGFDRADPDLVRLALSSASSESILIIPPPAPNATYSSNFSAPALVCSPVTNQTTYDNVSKAIFEQFANVDEGWSPIFFSWAGDPAQPPAFNSSFVPIVPETVGDSFYQLNIWVYSAAAHQVTDDVFINCILNNATYNVNISTQDSQQQSLQIKRAPSPIPVPYYDGESTLTGDILGETLSYAAVMAAMGHVLAGCIYSDQYGNLVTYSTSITSTGVNKVLLTDPGAGPMKQTATNATMTSTVETIFQNVTMSLLSSDRYTANQSAIAADPARYPPTTVSVAQSANIYVYLRLDLWLAYGIALIFAILCSVLGSSALLHNGLSYTNDFTTILRTTRNPGLDNLVAESEASGADPAPAHTLRGRLLYQRETKEGFAGFMLRGD